MTKTEVGKNVGGIILKLLKRHLLKQRLKDKLTLQKVLPQNYKPMKPNAKFTIQGNLVAYFLGNFPAGNPRLLFWVRSLIFSFVSWTNHKL